MSEENKTIEGVENQEVVKEQSQQAPQAPDPAEIYNNMLKERVGMSEEELQAQLQRANQYSWLESDNYAKNVLSAIQQGKDLRSIADKIGVNWKDASDDEVVMYHIKSQYPDAKPGLLGDLMREEFPGLFDEEATEIDRLKAKNRIRDIRNGLVEEANKFGEPTNHIEKLQEQAAQELKQYQQAVEQAKEVQSFSANGEIVFKDGELEHRYKVDKPQEVINAIKDPDALWALIGGLPMDQMIEAVSFLRDPDGYKSQLIEFGKTNNKISQEEDVRETDANNVQPQTPPEDITLPDNTAEWGPEHYRQFLKGAKPAGKS